MSELKGKVAVVTGGAGGIGTAIVVQLAQAGADVVVCDYGVPDETARVVEQVESLGRRAMSVLIDVTDRAAVEQMYADVVTAYGNVDIIVACAATGFNRKLIDLTWEEAHRIIDVCQNGVVHTCQLGAMRMVEQVEDGRAPGRIVIIGSIHAEVPFSEAAPYNMAKIAINQFCEHLALELGPYHINVNTINPGWIDTPNEHRKFSEESLDAGARAIPWKRMGRPEEIAGIVQFLVGDNVSYMSGACIRADGAMLPALALHLPEENS